MKSFLRIASVLAVLSGLSLHAAAQTSSATISGHVVDQSGGVVPNASVTLLNQQTNVQVTKHATSDNQLRAVWGSRRQAARQPACDWA